MQSVPEAEEGRLAQRFAQGRMHVDRMRDILQHRAHRQRMGEFAGELGDFPPDRLDAENAPIVAPRDDSDKAAAGTGFERLLTARDAANLLRLSPSWLAKARMRGDGPPYVKLGRSIRYTETAILQWMRSRQRFSTSER